MIKAKTDYLALPHRQIVKIAAHIVKQDRQIIKPKRREMRELCLECGAGISIEIEMRAIGRQPDPEAHTCAFAVRRKSAKCCIILLIVQVLPIAPQTPVNLGRIMIEAIASRGERIDHAGAILPAPSPSKIALDNAKLRLHRASLRRSWWLSHSQSSGGKASSVPISTMTCAEGKPWASIDSKRAQPATNKAINRMRRISA